MMNFRTHLKQIGLYDLTSLDVILNKVESQSWHDVSWTEKTNLTVMLLIMVFPSLSPYTGVNAKSMTESCNFH